jgi:hypothetical protein
LVPPPHAIPTQAACGLGRALLPAFRCVGKDWFCCCEWANRLCCFGLCSGGDTTSVQIAMDALHAAVWKEVLQTSNASHTAFAAAVGARPPTPAPLLQYLHSMQRSITALNAQWHAHASRIAFQSRVQSMNLQMVSSLLFYLNPLHSASVPPARPRFLLLLSRKNRYFTCFFAVIIGVGWRVSPSLCRCHHLPSSAGTDHCTTACTHCQRCAASIITALSTQTRRSDECMCFRVRYGGG